MNRLQLATLLSWAGVAGIQGRKRLQKIVFFLQKAGCPLDCHYTLHHFGPYSRDVADACDEMVAAGLIEETVEPQNGVVQYAYTLKPAIRDMVAREPDTHVQPFEELGCELIDPAKTPIWRLELGSTILYFFKTSNGWDDALAKACEFKRVKVEDRPSQAAMELAKRVQTRALNQ